ncbi:MAG: hypothetical protein HRU43_04225 [Simkaniaceae bacterium]|nr:hypothetical protein [Simkaniaceae bacterium]
MAIEGPASKLSAASDFLNEWQNTLLVSGCITYFVGRTVLPIFGKSAENYPCLAKMNNQFFHFWIFADFANLAGSGFGAAYTIKSVLSQPDRENRQIRGGQKTYNGGWVHLPMKGMTLDGDRNKWLARHTLSTALKIFSAYVAVHEGLKSIGALQKGPSSTLKVVSGVGGIFAYSHDLLDLSWQKQDYKKHSLHGRIAKEDTEQEAFDNAYLKNITYTQALKGLFIGVKFMALLSTLSKMEYGGLKKVMDHKYTDDLFNCLFVGITTTLFFQKIYASDNLANWQERQKTWATKYFFEDFLASRDFVRLLEAASTTLIDFGYDVLGETDIGKLGKFAKSFDSFLYVPKIAKRTVDLKDKLYTLYSEPSKEKAWNTSLAAIKLLSDTFAALKFIAAFGGIAYLSERTKLGYLKNGAGVVSAVMTISEEIFFPDKKKEAQRKFVILASAASLFLNGFGGLSAAFGDRVPAPATGHFKPWVYNFAKVNGTALNIIINYSKA